MQQPEIENKIKNLQPKALWENFINICHIPHITHHEAKLSQYIKKLAEQLKLDVKIDKVNNVIIRKPATKGMENREPIILQSHLDMVGEKDSEIKHNFLKDPIQPYIDGDWIKAKGTTLGADNGIGVAAIMAILQSKELKHGPITAILTADEEQNFSGIEAISKMKFNEKILLNLDSEEDTTFYIGAAGGIRLRVEMGYKKTAIPANHLAYAISVGGLRGGHSGTDIHLGLGNANKILNRLLWQTAKLYNLRLASISAGGIFNAIPIQASAKVVIPKTYADSFLEFVKQYTETVNNEIQSVQPDLKIKATAIKMPKSLLDKKTQRNLLNTIYGCPTGVISMSKNIPGLVETSANLASINSTTNKIKIIIFIRSELNSLTQDVANSIGSIFELIGATLKSEGYYPAWQGNTNSNILKIMQKIYYAKFRKKPKLKAIHAGLEISLLVQANPHLDTISFGPTILAGHSPNEKVGIKSVKKFWDIVTTTLENIPEKQ